MAEFVLMRRWPSATPAQAMAPLLKKELSKLGHTVEVFDHLSPADEKLDVHHLGQYAANAIQNALATRKIVIVLDNAPYVPANRKISEYKFAEAPKTALDGGPLASMAGYGPLGDVWYWLNENLSSDRPGSKPVIEVLLPAIACAKKIHGKEIGYPHEILTGKVPRSYADMYRLIKDVFGEQPDWRYDVNKSKQAKLMSQRMAKMTARGIHKIVTTNSKFVS